MYHKWQSYDAWFWDMDCNRQSFLSFWTTFSPFNTLTTPKIKILKKGKKPWRYYHFTHVYDKWQSNDLCFLRYGVQWTEFFVILEPFWHFYPPNNLKNQTFEKNEKNTRRYYHFTHVYHKWQPSWDMEHDGHNFFVIFVNFLSFFVLLPH